MCAVAALSWPYPGSERPRLINLIMKPMDNKFIDALLKEKNFVRVSNLEKRLKKECEASNFKASHVHIIGAGSMGKGIATWCALKGIRVTLQDISEERIKSAVEFARKYFRVKK